VPDSNDWAFGNFTFDFWINLSDLSDNHGLFGQYVNSTSRMYFWWDPPNTLKFYDNEQTFEFPAQNCGIQLDTWHHIALVRSGSVGYIFVDGEQKATKSGWSAYSNIAADMQIGRSGNSNQYYTRGYVDEFRISDTARWTSSFTPETSEYTSDEDTLLLFHFNEESDPPQQGTPILCWQLTGRYKQTGRLFQRNGAGAYPKEFRIPSNVDKDSIHLIDEGKPISKDEYKLI